MKIVISKSRIKKWLKKEKCENCKNFHKYFLGAGYCSKNKDYVDIKSCPKVLLEDNCKDFEENRPDLSMIRIIKEWIEYNEVFLALFGSFFIAALITIGGVSHQNEIQKNNPITIYSNGKYVGDFFEISDRDENGCTIARYKETSDVIKETKICGEYIIKEK